MSDSKPLPQIIKDVGFDFGWDEADVWALDYPTEEADISLLDWHFDVPFWNNGAEWYTLRPIDVVNDKEKWAKEYARTMKADLSHPIDIMENKGRWVILDGLHRLLKYRLLGLDKVQVRKIPRQEIPKISRKLNRGFDIDQAIIGFAKRIVAKSKELKDKYTDEIDAPADYVSIFCQSDDEYDRLVKAAATLGEAIEDHGSGPLFHIEPIQTVAGEVRLLRIRKYDKDHPEWGHADFVVKDYADFKKKHISRNGFLLIERPGVEMIELTEDGCVVRAYFLNPTVEAQLMAEGKL